MLEHACDKFIKVLSSKSPVPGGGVSAYVDALGMALGSRVGNLILEKKYEAMQEDILELLKSRRN